MTQATQVTDLVAAVLLPAEIASVFQPKKRFLTGKHRLRREAVREREAQEDMRSALAGEAFVICYGCSDPFAVCACEHEEDDCQACGGGRCRLYDDDLFEALMEADDDHDWHRLDEAFGVNDPERDDDDLSMMELDLVLLVDITDGPIDLNLTPPDTLTEEMLDNFLWINGDAELDDALEDLNWHYGTSITAAELKMHDFFWKEHERRNRRRIQQKQRRLQKSIERWFNQNPVCA